MSGIGARQRVGTEVETYPSELAAATALQLNHSSGDKWWQSACQYVQPVHTGVAELPRRCPSSNLLQCVRFAKSLQISQLPGQPPALPAGTPAGRKHRNSVGQFRLGFGAESFANGRAPLAHNSHSVRDPAQLLNDVPRMGAKYHLARSAGNGFPERPKMDSVTACTVVGWIVFHAAAIALAWATRVSNGSRLETLLQLGFFAAMAAVASAIWISRQHSDSIWMASAITLIAMVVTAVIDFQRASDHYRAAADATSR